MLVDKEIAAPARSRFSEIREYHRAQRGGCTRGRSAKRNGQLGEHDEVSAVFADGTHSPTAKSIRANDYIPREASTRCSGDGTEIIISLDCAPPAGLGRSCGPAESHWVSVVACSNAQMIGGIAVASRRLASLPPVRRFVALTMAR